METLASRRMEQRIEAHVDELVQRAAALTRVEVGTFMRAAIYKAALETIGAHEFPVLQAIDGEALIEAFGNPPQPSEAFRVAYGNLEREESLSPR